MRLFANIENLGEIKVERIDFYQHSFGIFVINPDHPTSDLFINSSRVISIFDENKNVIYDRK